MMFVRRWAAACGQLGHTKIIFAGGIKPVNNKEAAAAAECLSNAVFEFNTFERPCPSFKRTTPTLSGKAKPLVVELHSHLLVLDGSHVSGASITPFEAYNPGLKEWYEMTLPFFFNPFYSAHKSFPYFSYAANDNAIWASSPTTPVFKYNPRTTFWKIDSIRQMVGFPFMQGQPRAQAAA